MVQFYIHFNGNMPKTLGFRLANDAYMPMYVLVHRVFQYDLFMVVQLFGRVRLKTRSGFCGARFRMDANAPR
jgi:hypothetical protein